MLQVSRQVSYSLLLLTILARKSNRKKPISIRTISESTRLPYFFLSHLAAKLKKAGVVDSKKGVSGGYFIKKPLNRITIENIILAIGENVKLVNCLNKKSCLFKELCPAYPFWSGIEQEIKGRMKRYTLGDLILNSKR
jgi:Rrf2 family iron-sulfur cluster assembly transcriptional regulator